MENNIFRSKVIKRISSPEQLNEYIKVSSPAVWLIFTVIILLFIGVGAWGILGHIETKQDAFCIVKDGNATCYVQTQKIDGISNGSTVRINGVDGKVSYLNDKPIEVSANFDSYAMHVGEINQGDWLVPIDVDIKLEDGVYNCEIILESISPISFLIN